MSVARDTPPANPHQITIRSALPSGGETELSKIVNGHGDLMFYGHSNPWGGLERWWLIDLRVFRAALIRNRIGEGHVKWGRQSNADGTEFVSFQIRSFPAEAKLVVTAG